MMKKIRLCAVAVLFSLCATIASAAPSPRDMVFSLNGDVVLSASIADVAGLKTAGGGKTLIASFLKSPFGGALSALDSFSSVSLRAVMDQECEMPESVVLSAVIAENAPSPLILPVPLTPPDGKFSPAVPEGMKLEMLGTFDTGLPGFILKFARLEADGVPYLLAVSGDAAMMEKMLKAEAAPASVTSGEILLEGGAAGGLVQMLGVPRPVKAEIAVNSGESSLRFSCYANFTDQLSALCGKDVRALLCGGAPSVAPVLMGGDPVLLVKNICLSCIPENFRLSDILEGDMLAMADSAVNGSLQGAGLDFADLLSILRGNITFGIGGRVSYDGKDFPGMWLNLRGAPEKLASMLAMLAPMLDAEPYESPVLKGFRVTAPVTAFAGFGANGMTLAVMNGDQLSLVPDTAPLTAEALEPRTFAWTMNVKSVMDNLAGNRDDIKKLFGMLPDEESRTSAEGMFDMITGYAAMMNGIVSKIAVYSDDFDTVILDIDAPGLIPMISGGF